MNACHHKVFVILSSSIPLINIFGSFGEFVVVNVWQWMIQEISVLAKLQLRWLEWLHVCQFPFHSHYLFMHHWLLKR